jgi:hypothetical protein
MPVRRAPASRFRFNGAERFNDHGPWLRVVPEPPNPFVNKTQIGFYLPEATEATLTIFDETGRTLFTQTGDFGQRLQRRYDGPFGAEHHGRTVLQTGNG